MNKHEMLGEQTMRFEIKAGKKLRVEGPASVLVRNGEVEALGKILRPRERLTIPKSKVAFIIALEDSTVELSLGEDGKVEKLEDIAIPYEWREVVEKISSMSTPLTLLILGGVDVGKTVFTLYLTNSLTSQGRKVIIIDEDLGQSEIGAPTTIGMAYLRRPVVSFSQARQIGAYFVGSTSPAGLIHRVLVGIKSLLDKAREYDAQYVIINTDGWIYGRDAREFKMSMIAIARPHIVVAIQRSNEIEPIIKPFETQRWLQIIRLVAPQIIRTRTLEERRLLRESMYHKYFEGGKIIKLPLNKISFMYSEFGSTFPSNVQEVNDLQYEMRVSPLYVGMSADLLVLVVPRDEKRIKEIKDYLKKRGVNKTIRILREGEERGLIVGLYDNLGEFLGIGVVQEIDYRRRYIKVLSRVEGNIAMIKLGRIKLNGKFSEKAKVDSWPL